MFRENITEPEILDSLDVLIGRWAKEREAGEGFGDFTVRAGIIRPVLDPARDFWEVTTRGNYVRTDLNALNALPKVERILALAETNAQLEKLDAEGRVAWALENLPGDYVLSSSFGIQAAVSLHLVNQIRPDIPVILTDTGYLFPETYQFIDELTDKLRLNLKVYRATESAAWQEARYGKLWEQGVEGIEKYNEINKVEPMSRALKELNAQTWFAGLRREQSGSRATLPVLAVQRGVFKVLPIIDWDNRTVYQYLQKHGLKYHPLWDQGYLSVGDTHTTRKWEPGMAEEETRFFGLKRECGLHEG